MIATLLLAAVVGVAPPEIPLRSPDLWVQGGPQSLEELRGKVVLIRFFTSPDCPYCSATAPALNEFHDEFASRGLVVVGIFTPKPDPRPVTRDEVFAAVKEYGFKFPVAIDAGWTALRSLWLDRERGAQFTSASLLIDRQGIVRHVQRGGAYARDAEDPDARRDYTEMRASIEKLLAQK